jgi:hypothetical protein
MAFRLRAFELWLALSIKARLSRSILGAYQRGHMKYIVCAACRWCVLGISELGPRPGW